jgi:hypothetical protein
VVDNHSSSQARPIVFVAIEIALGISNGAPPKAQDQPLGTSFAYSKTLTVIQRPQMQERHVGSAGETQAEDRESAG